MTAVNPPGYDRIFTEPDDATEILRLFGQLDELVAVAARVMADGDHSLADELAAALVPLESVLDDLTAVAPDNWLLPSLVGRLSWMRRSLTGRLP